MEKPYSHDYFERRAEEERVAADTATDERAAQSHRELADRYRALAGGARPATAEPQPAGALSRNFRIVP